MPFTLSSTLAARKFCVHVGHGLGRGQDLEGLGGKVGRGWQADINDRGLSQGGLNGAEISPVGVPVSWKG